MIMKESMKYDTNYYQLRDYVLRRMYEIISRPRVYGGIVFFGDSLTELCDLIIRLIQVFQVLLVICYCILLMKVF